MILVYQLLIGLATGMVAAYFTAQFALRRFYSEKWWEKRLDNFSLLIGHVYNIKRSLEYWLDREMESQGFEVASYPLPTDELTEMANKSRLGSIELKRLNALSAFTHGVFTELLIKQYFERTDEIHQAWCESESDRVERYEDEIDACQNLLDALITEAHTSLKLKY